MSMILTYWEDPLYKNTEDDFDEILEVRLKSVKEIPALIATKPAHCTMISTERTGPKKYFKEIWRKGQPIPSFKPKVCPLCFALL